MNNTMVLVGIAAIDARTENKMPSLHASGPWVQCLDQTYNELGKQTIEQLPEQVKKSITNVIICSSADDSHARAKCMENDRARPRDVLSALGVSMSAIIAEQLPAVKKTFKVDAACASGIVALEIAQFYGDDITLVLGIEKPTSNNFLKLFRLIGAVAENVSRYYVPFDQRRAGFMMAEGAAALAVTSYDTAQRLGLKILATIDQISTETIYSHPTSPSDPKKIELLIQSTVDQSKKSLSDIGWWDAHATATPAGDELEYEIFSKIFKNYNTKISSYKSRVGHCMSASALVEIANAVRSLQHNIISENFNLDPAYAVVNDPRIIVKAEKTESRTFIKTSFGFGGRNGVAIITVH